MQPEATLARSPADGLEQRFRAFVRERAFPCVGAKSALGRGALRVLLARDIASAWDDLRIYAALRDFANVYRAAPAPFQSLAVIFAEGGAGDEVDFERNLWARLQSLSDKDGWLGQPYDPRVSSDADDPHFSLSFGGEAFFVVGLHPAASRPARRFEAPVLVFNPHDQFERLRQDGRYEPLRASIVARDVALAGAPNPMIARFGESSEARQYSGRQVGPDWRCPFHVKPRTPPHDDD
ncbi:MAG: YqcI/YcgG family protein [Caulobacteraceae bacterium]|nr:YqcI/YcgG family protein [Caulobacteraceae bacterium]